jgi:16S rRNA (guanine1207-N2)-methyltransferase
VSDAALQALYARFATLPGPLWWFADEHVAQSLPAVREDCLVLCNRADSAAAIQAGGFAVTLGDFQLPADFAAPGAVCYRVSKEKPLVHYLINLALRNLPLGGSLLLAGYKNDGLKTYATKAAKLVGGKPVITKCASDAYLAEIVKEAELSGELPDEDYPVLRAISEEPLLYSKPGIFGWKKIDRGSARLIAQLPTFLQEFPEPPQRLVDLGCGYGYIAVMAAQVLQESEWLLTDNNATALLACEKNCAEHGIHARFALADCAQGVTGPVDAVLCNPPFHQGFSVEGDLTDRFLQAAHRLLSAKGQALFVVNQFIPLQRKAEGLFTSSEILDEGEGFRVIRLRR